MSRGHCLLQALITPDDRGKDSPCPAGFRGQAGGVKCTGRKMRHWVRRMEDGLALTPGGPERTPHPTGGWEGMLLDRDHEDRGGSSLESVEEVDPRGGDRGADAGGPCMSTSSMPVLWRRGWGWTELSTAPRLCASASGLRPVVTLCTSPHPRPTAASRCSVLNTPLLLHSLFVHGPRAASRSWCPLQYSWASLVAQQ